MLFVFPFIIASMFVASGMMEKAPHYHTEHRINCDSNGDNCIQFATRKECHEQH